MQYYFAINFIKFILKLTSEDILNIFYNLMVYKLEDHMMYPLIELNFTQSESIPDYLFAL